jgi:hypothetical protein
LITVVVIDSNRYQSIHINSNPILIGQTTDEGDLAAPSVYDLPNSDYNFLLVGLRSDPIVEDFDFRIDQIEVTPVPVPAAVWLLGSGLFGLVGLRKKINK